MVASEAKHLLEHRVKTVGALALSEKLPEVLVDLISPRLLRSLGLELGADVPVCIGDGPAFIGGIGEALTPVPHLPSAGLVLVNPGVTLSTASVFKAHGEAVSEPAPAQAVPEDADGLAFYLKARRNDLTAAAVSLAPKIEDVLSAIAATPHCLLSRMSGSGTTCFGLYGERAQAEAATKALQSRHPDWWIAATELLSGV